MESRFRKKLIITGAAVVIVLAAAITFLVSQSSRILEQRLEQALGENFKAKSLSLSWNRIELNEPRFMKDGQITAQAKRIILKPETLALLKPGFPISSVVLEEPSLTLQIDEHGQWVAPFVVGEQPGTPSASKPGPVSIQEIEIKEGTLFFQDQRLPEPNRIEFRKINLSLHRNAFPLEDRPSTFALQMQLAGNLVSGSASGSGTIRFKPLAVDGRFEGQDLIVLDGGAAGPAARVQSVSFTAASKGTSAKGLLLSDLVLIKPYLRLESDRKGRLISPLPVGWPKAPPGEKEGTPAPLEVKNLKIEGGELLYLGAKAAERPEPSRIEFQKIDLSLDRVAFPLEDKPSAFVLQVKLAGNRVSGSAGGKGIIRFKPLAVDGRFEGQDLLVLDGSAAGPAARVQSVSFTAASKGTAAKGLLLSDLVLVKPYLRLESDREGKLLPPLPVGLPKAPPGEKEGAPAPLEVKNLTIEGGELLYLDGKAAQPPVPLSITGIDLTADQLSFPAGSQNTTYRLSARLPGNQSTGVLTSSGNTALKTLDTDAKFSLSDLDLTSYKTYVLKEGDADISRGFFDLDMDLGIKKRMLNAPAHSVLRDIRFVGGSNQGDRFLGLPRDLVVKALQNNNNQISFDIMLEGSLDNPEFSLRERLVIRMTAGLARRLGLSVVETGGKVIIKGGEIIKGVGGAITKPFE